MAIDNAEKRRSVAGIPFFIGLGVTPNSSKDAEWRQQVAWGYSGISIVATATFAIVRMSELAWLVADMESAAWVKADASELAWLLADMEDDGWES